jgi:hypothetical protein
MAYTALNTGMKQEKGVTYTATTDDSNDWNDVPSNTYFYDKDTNLPYYKNSNDDILSVFSNPNGGNSTTELLVQEWIVDPINGDDATGIKGSYINAFSTIEGAETAATSGDIIKIISDVTEAGMGKDGIEYRINPGVEIFYPESGSNTPRTGLTQAFLWTDEGKGPISFKVYGGIHNSEGDWYGNFNRGIVYIFNEGSDIRIYGEHVELKGNDGWISKVSAKCNLEIHSTGDIISGYSGVQTYTSQGSTIILNAGGSIIGSVRMVDEQNLAGNTIVFNAGKMIQALGHPISTLRSFIYCNSSTSTAVSHISLNTPVIDIFEDNHSTLSNTQGFVFTFQHGKIKLDINADVITMRNPDTVTNPNSYGLFSLYRTNTTEIDIVMNVKRLILGTSFAFDRGGQIHNKLNARVKWISNTEIIFKTAVLEDGNAFDCDRITHYFEGLTKIIINPDAITLGQKTLGGSLDNNAYIVGKVISNGDIYDNTFVNTFNGVDYATGIPELTMLNSTLINWDHYKNL